MEKVYVVSRYAGDVAANIQAAIRFCRFVIDQERMPIASHLLYPQILNDNDPAERERGLQFGLQLLELCDEVWVFGKQHSAGMIQEIETAARLGIPTRYYTEELEVQHEFTK